MSGLLLDQCVPRSTGKMLRDAGWNVVHAGEIGLSRASDIQIIQYALDTRRVIVTLDADFHALLAVQGMAWPSVVRIRIDGLNGSMLAALLQKIWPRIQTQIESGAMATITETAIRIKTLPV